MPQIDGEPIAARKSATNATDVGEEQDSFYAKYNKEIKVNQN